MEGHFAGSSSAGDGVAGRAGTGSRAVLVRGNPNNPGPEVPRQFLEVLTGPNRQAFKHGSGRLDLAQAIAARENPLTARVLVNRVWLHHFGQGIVRTPSDFGLRGEPPTHPELLDWMAASFMDNGWSIKQLHRLIMLSATYQQSATADGGPSVAHSSTPESQTLDPENRLLGRMNRRRLEFESLRDSLLAVSGRLDPKEGGRAVELTTAPFTGRRTVYGFIDRQNLPGLFRTFDFANPDASNPQRYDTTVPQQALFLMNSPFVEEQARAAANRPDVVGLQEPRARIDRLYRVFYGALSGARGAGPWRPLRERHRPPDVSPPGSREEYAKVLLLANEFSFVD